MADEKEYKVGDKLWYVIDSSRLAILCTIREINDFFRKRHPGSYLFYDLDEPIGHDVAGHDMFDGTKEELLEELAAETWDEYTPETLEKYRERQKKFIASTWSIKHPSFPNYPTKEEGVEWFNF